MANVDRKRLEYFLNQYKCKTTDAVMEALEPLYQIAERGVFHFAQKEGIDIEKIRRDLEFAVSQKPEKILLVFQSQSFLMPDWMAESVWQEIIKNVGCNLCNSIGEALWSFFGDSFWDSFGGHATQLLHRGLSVTLGESFLDDFLDAWRTISSWPMPRDCVLLFVGFSMVNKGEEAKKLLPLLKLLGEGVAVLGTKKDEPNTWLVLVG